MFSGQELPSYANLREVEAMKTRLAELEAELAKKETEVVVEPSSEVESATPPSPAMETPRQVIFPVEKRNWRAQGLSLRTKLPLTAILLLALAFLTATIFSVRAARSSLVDSLRNNLIVQTSSEAELVRAYLTWTKSMAVDLAAAAEVTPFDEEGIKSTIYQTLQRNDQIFGSTIAYEPYAFKPDLYYWSPYYSRTTQGDIHFTQLGNPDYNYFQWDWYTLPKKENQPVLSPPYYDEGGGEIWMVTWSVPFYDKAGKFMGVATTDMSFQQTQEFVRQVELGREGYAFLVNQQGTILGIGDKGGQYKVMEDSIAANTNTQEAKEWNSMLQAMTSGQSGFAQVTDPQGKPVFVAYEPISSDTGWYLGLAYPQDELFQPAQRLQNNLILFSILITAIASIVLFIITRSVTNPIQQLATQAKLFSQGQLNLNTLRSEQLTHIQTKDELEDLGNAFNQMIHQLAGSFQSLEERVASRTHDLELASEVGRNVSAKVGNLYGLLDEAVELIRSRFNLYYTQVYTTDPSGRSITLRAGTGEVGKQLLKRGHHLLINPSSLNGRAASEKQTVVVPNTVENPRFLPNPLLPNTRSEMTVPLIVGDRVVGVLDMQSEEVNALNPENQPAFEALAGQLAIAIQNASLFEQVQQGRLELENQAKQQAYQNWTNFLNAIEREEKVGYVYNQSEVAPLAKMEDGSAQGNTLHTSIKVAGAEIGGIQVSDDSNRKWTPTEAAVLNETAAQLSRHIENLRLLAQSDKYRLEAEEISNRLTREGWKEYLTSRKNLAEGYIYENNKVQALIAARESGSKSIQSYPIYIREEHIGSLSVDPKDADAQNINELISTVTQQLGSHIENLRLLEQAQDSRQEVEKSQEHSQAILQSVTLPMVITRLSDNTLIFINRPATEVAKVKYEEAINQPAPNFYYDVDERAKFVSELRAKGEVSNMTVQLLRGGREKFWALISARLFEYQGEQSILTTFMDITDRIIAQEAVLKRAAELQTVAEVSITTARTLEPDLLLQTVVDLAKEKFNLYHAHIYLADESWSTLMLASGAGETGRKMVADGHSIPMDAEKSLVARATRERQALIVNNVHLEKDFLPNPILPDTRAEMAVPMIVGDKVIGVFDVQSEIEDRFTQEDASIFTTLASQAAIALQNARSYMEQAATVTQLRELDRLKSSFLANMSHELRTPLNSILGFTDVMLEELDGPLTPNMDNDLKLIQKNGKHLLHLINDVLDMAKIESGKMNLVIEKFNLNETIEDVMNITSSLANEKSLALFIEPDSDKNVFIRADHTRLRQVLINLVNNGIKFTEKGSVSVCIEHKENDVLIAIKDTGLGIPADHLESVFQEFTQVDSTTTRKAGGTGLGLPISRRLIEMHGGKLWAESSGLSGKGSTFNILLPIEAIVAEAITSEPFEKR